MVIMIVVAQLYGVGQLAVLGWAARSVRWRVLVLAVLAGLYGASVLAIAVQVAGTRAFSALTGKPLFEVTALAGYTVDPFVEEVAKLLPVVLLYWLFTSVRRQWGYTDLVLAAAAAGAGFGLAEQLLRYSGDAHRAIAAAAGGWVIPQGIFVSPAVPGPTGLLSSWLPAGVGGFSILGSNAAAGIDIHLVWSAVAGLGLALILKSPPARARLLGVGLIALAGLDHAANNAQGGGTVARAFAEPFTAARDLVWLYPLIALAVAIRWDRQVLDRGLRAEPDVRLASEGTDLATSVVALARTAVLRLPWSWPAVTGFVRLRRAYLYGRDQPSTDLVELRRGVGRMVTALDVAAGPGGAAVWDHVSGRMRSRYGPAAVRARITARPGTDPAAGRQRLLAVLWLALLVWPLGYFVIGGQPALGGFQALYESAVLFRVVVAVAVVSGTWLAWAVVQGFRAVPSLRRVPVADPPASAVLLLTMRCGALALLLVGAFLAVTGTPADGHLPAHILDAVGDALLVAGLLLAILALLASPPLGLVVLSTGAPLLVWTGLTAALAGELAIAGAVGSVGILLNQAADPGSGPGGGSGPGASPADDLLAAPERLRGQTPSEVERTLDGALDPARFTKAPVRKGTGTRWFDKNGNSFTVERQPQVGGDLHSGWYLKVSYRGRTVRIPLAGNPALGGP